MLRLALRSVRARWGRVVLTALAIVASTAFLSGTFIFRDTIQRTFDALFADVYERVDAYVQSSNTTEGFLGFESRGRMPAAVVDQVAVVDGVVDAQAFVQDDAVVIAKDGEPLERPTAPTFGGTVNSGELSVWRVAQGRLPVGPTEVVLDVLTARDAGYVVGDTVKVNAEGGSRDFQLVGIVEYDDIISPADATWALFDSETAQEFVAKPGFIDSVLVKGDGTLTDEELSQRIEAVLDLDVAESLTSAEITEQTQTDIEKSLSFITIFLAVFSFIALGVGAFVIYNVFSITAAQRQRENALLRAIGASRRQVTSALLVESLAVGVVGSLLGLLGGVGLAVGIRNLLDLLDYGIPARGLSLEAPTVVITLVAGVVTALVAAIAPAIGAGRVPPVAAMADTAFERTGSVRGRIIGAVVSAASGSALIVWVLAGGDSILLGFGLLFVFVGVLLVGPVMAKPIARVMGEPVQRLRGITGGMARRNVERNPKRTARTAAPVLVGVSLVCAATVFAASIKTQIREAIESQLATGYVINSSNGGSLSLSQSFVDELNTLPEVGAATGPSFVQVVGASGKPLAGVAVDPVTADGILLYVFEAGSFESLTPDGTLISEGEAQRTGLAVGDTRAVIIDGSTRLLTVQGIFEPSSGPISPSRIYHRDTFAGTSESTLAPIISLTRAPGVPDEQFRNAVNASIEAYGIGELQDTEQFIGSRSEKVDQFLTFIYGLLMLSIIIAVFGIVLTLLLAVYERRRETGLLRAVGMNRSQVRTTVRWESVITTLYGALVGVVLGLGLGYVVILALRDEGLTRYSVPLSDIGVILVLAFVVGVVAAVIPARRATRVDILTAIATD